jgi:hypothetical protein
VSICKPVLSLPSDRKAVMLVLMLVPGIQACKQFWILIIYLTFMVSVRSSGNSALIKVVYRDGKTLFS